jgi:putative MATE family efflux protein
MLNTCIVMNMSIRSQGNPQFAMLIMMTGAMINTILDPIFIWVLHMGTAGAAWATVISQMISATMGIGYHFSARSTLKIRFQTCLPDMTLIARIVPLGFSPFIMDIAGSVQNGMLNAQLQHYGGDMAVAAIGIIFAVSTLLMMVNFGITDGLQPIVGYNYGAGRYDRVKQTVRMACFWAFGSTFAGICLIELFPSMFARLFCGDSPELVSLASHGMRIFLACFPLVGIQLVGTRYFQAIGKAGTATLFGLLRPVFLFVPLLFWLSHFWGLSGLWSTAPLTDTLAALVTVAWLARALRKLPRQAASPICPSIAERRDIG